MIFVTDAVGKMVYLSQEWTVLTGQQLEDVSQRGWSKVIHPDDLAIVGTVVAEATVARSEFTVRYRLLSPDGRAIWVAAGAVPSFGPPERTFLGFLGSISLLAAPPPKGTASGALGRFSRPSPVAESEPRSVLELVADHLITAHALIMQDGGTCALAAVEVALHEIGRELARVSETAQDGSNLH
ncbi:hypothetical protein AFCDBAGC_1012 [Methylobacterium cerastii]|uniref:histidine kinase n=1 Tax=Methylobacterium cerastii TaxID=932741 RepID=A0ABQ4QDJ9_9HYPH|nr:MULTISPECIES: PAS domain-containing protein [Methylobacterium]TXM91970.1 PAS domain-containing protein [Methylobacterium sp. WL122]TXM69842.1 PAS domain-containing protein [Methylobacterium sp. WL120]TXM73916.1 PAS domain-containing protein [Methylobacterium sp. WL12]TXM96811.1 PAS domain-containing protein [Methylobacterium sp. WL103]TXN84405.1 PAS domain-containing protein [Methylobacterium sp. WL8]